MSFRGPPTGTRHLLNHFFTRVPSRTPQTCGEGREQTVRVSATGCCSPGAQGQRGQEGTDNPGRDGDGSAGWEAGGRRPRPTSPGEAELGAVSVTCRPLQAGARPLGERCRMWVPGASGKTKEGKESPGPGVQLASLPGAVRHPGEHKSLAEPLEPLPAGPMVLRPPSCPSPRGSGQAAPVLGDSQPPAAWGPQARTPGVASWRPGAPFACSASAVAALLDTPCRQAHRSAPAAASSSGSSCHLPCVQVSPSCKDTIILEYGLADLILIRFCLYRPCFSIKSHSHVCGVSGLGSIFWGDTAGLTRLFSAKGGDRARVRDRQGGAGPRW